MSFQEREHQVGLSDACWYPASSFLPPGEKSRRASELGTEFREALPGWIDLVLGNTSDLPVVLIHQDWWTDRRVEKVQNFPSTTPRWKKKAFSLGFPPSFLSRRIGEKWLDFFPGARLVTHWPFLELPQDEKRTSVLGQRAQAVGPLPERQVAEVHSPNILLTEEELLTWLDQDRDNRRLAITYPIDPRLQEHFIRPESHKALVTPRLIEHASVVYLKVGDLHDGKELLMTKNRVARAIMEGEQDNPYAQRLTELADQVGRQVSGPACWVITVRFRYSEDFLKRYVDYVKKILK